MKLPYFHYISPQVKLIYLFLIAYRVLGDMSEKLDDGLNFLNRQTGIF
jgi:hypothetical protein